ncbi:MAG: hypothetical protein AMJ77_06855 [Dehalococcoidia bacterium SM23_28_2]|nr:MAG: hypothetical protein AMJ77_06855 [Dehalococcoidia bacterium SM23_28_2]
MEFVVLSNARVKRPVTLPGGITLVPCFQTELESANSRISELTLEMMHRGCFVYDGWLPVDDWQADTVCEAISTIDSALAVLVLRTSAWFSWEPKYSPIVRGGMCYDLEQQDVVQMNQLANSVNEMNEKDSRALLSSIGWLSHSVRASEAPARFLFAFLSIEALATHIEGTSGEVSAFGRLRCEKLNGQQRKERRQECIRNIMDQLLDANPEKAVEQAYSQCVVGLGQRLQAHLTHVFGGETHPIELLFKRRVDGKTLYDLRHEIAHGKMDALSQAQREAVFRRARDLERIARRYIFEVLGNVVGCGLESGEGQTLLSVTPRLREGIVSNESMYKGPIDMAEVYSSMYMDSIRGSS